MSKSLDFNFSNFDEFVLSFYDEKWYKKVSDDFKQYYTYEPKTQTIVRDGLYYDLKSFLTSLHLNPFEFEPRTVEDFMELEEFAERMKRFPKVGDDSLSAANYALTENITFVEFIQRYRSLARNSFQTTTEILDKVKIKRHFTDKLAKIATEAKDTGRDYLLILVNKLDQINREHTQSVPDDTILELITPQPKQFTEQDLFEILSTERFEFHGPIINHIYPKDYPDKKNLLYLIFFGNEREHKLLKAEIDLPDKRTTFYKFIYSIEKINIKPNLQALNKFVYVDGKKFNVGGYSKQKSLFTKSKMAPIKEILNLGKLR